MQAFRHQLNNSQVITAELRQTLQEPSAPSDPYYMLLLGTDGRPGETEYRADSIILARVDPIHKRVTMLLFHEIPVSCGRVLT